MQQHTLIRTTALVLATAGLITLTACGGGTSSASASPPNRVAADITMSDSLTGGFAEGVVADPDTGDLYIGTDSSGTAQTNLILKAGAQDSSFSAWFAYSALTTTGTNRRLVTGLRIRSGVLYACNTVLGSAQVIGVRLSDKTVTATMSLPASERFCNDLAFDDAGNLFVTTNSMGGSSTESVYKLAAAKVQAGGTVPSSDWVQWSTSADAVNGLVYDSANNKLIWRKGLQVVSSPTSGSTATVTKEFDVTDEIDGLQLTRTGKLLAITSAGAKVYPMSGASKGNPSAVSGGTDCETTVTIYGDDAYCSASYDRDVVLRLVGAGNL